MRTFKAAAQGHVSSALRRIASDIQSGSVSPVEASACLHRVLMALAQTPDQALMAMGPIEANSREEVMDGFRSANPSLTEEQLHEIADHWEEHKHVVKDKAGQ